jgi:gluconate kinase
VILKASSRLSKNYADMLAKIPPNIVEMFLRDAEKIGWKKAANRQSWSMPEEYLKYNLLEEGQRQRLKATVIGRVLMDSATTVRGGGDDG